MWKKNVQLFEPRIGLWVPGAKRKALLGLQGGTEMPERLRGICLSAFVWRSEVYPIPRFQYGGFCMGGWATSGGREVGYLVSTPNFWWIRIWFQLGMNSETLRLKSNWERCWFETQGPEELITDSWIAKTAAKVPSIPGILDNRYKIVLRAWKIFLGQ